VTREWVDDMKRKPVDKRWVMRCDVRKSGSGTRCTTESEPAANQGDLPPSMFRDQGWFIAIRFGDICPSCLASGVVPKSPEFGV
jgi:hypothetical protein